MADCIERQAAIDMFQRQAYDDWNQGAGTTWANAFSEAADMIEDLPSADELTIVTEYCRKRNLVIITMESFRVLQAYYNRQNGMDGE